MRILWHQVFFPKLQQRIKTDCRIEGIDPEGGCDTLFHGQPLLINIFRITIEKIMSNHTAWLKSAFDTDPMAAALPPNQYMLANALTDDVSSAHILA